MTYKTIGQIAVHKPLARLGMDELAARQREIKPSGGIVFARNADGDEKSWARQHVLDLFAPDRWNGRLHLLTMPGVAWRFERKLLGIREVGWMRAPSPRRTLFTSIENDRAIYFAAAGQMPGVHTPRALIKQNNKFAFTEIGVKSAYASFLFGNVDDLMKSDWATPWDAAWLDYTGPMSVKRLEIIAQFWHRYIREILVVTALKARWDQKTSAAIDAAGGHSEWLRDHLDGEVLHDIEYVDTSPMAQFAVRKADWDSTARATNNNWKFPLV